MTTKKLTAAATVLAMVMSFGTAAFAEGDGECTQDCGPAPKGNNGWGNGIDPENPGSRKGPPSQVETKINDAVWDKFIDKHEGR